MNGLKIMISFLTRIPVGKIDFSLDKFERAIKFTQIVGVIIGSLMFCVAYFIKDIPNKMAVGFVLSILYIFITGALHLDGLCDSIDGLFSGREKIRILEIMKDSRIGTFGGLSLIILILGQIIFLGEADLLTIFMFPIVGRCSLYIASKNADYCREDGMGKVFVEKGKSKSCFIYFLFTNIFLFIIAILLLDIKKIIAILISYLISYLIVNDVKKKIGGITGDILGMIVEISQLSFIIVTYILNYLN